ncbi:U3 snoRNP protein [Coemansia sp. S16]|nr:U3 snoRNP protein [Coemansia sp. S16]
MGKKRSSTTPSVGQPASVAADSFAQTIPDSFIKQFINRPGAFVVPSATARAAAMEVVGSTYNAANYSDKFGLYDDWNTVLESGFDPSLQIWELINVRNEPVLKYTTDIMKELSQLIDSVNDESGSSASDSDELEEIEGESAESEDDAVSVEVSEGAMSEDESDIEEQLGLDSEADSASDLDSSNDKDMDESDEEDEDDEGSTRKRSVLDDEFFSLADVEKFADDAEEEDMRDRAILAGDYPKAPAGQDGEESSDSEEDDEDDIDMFQDLTALDDDEDGESDEETAGAKADEMMYTDFFKAPRGSKRGIARASLEQHAKRVKFDPNTVGESDASEPEADLESEPESHPVTRTRNLFADDDDDAEDGNAGTADAKSDFEKRQEKLQGLISKLEDEAVDKKHWAMTGEVTSAARPKDSLLEEDLEFEHVQKPVPIVTQEATQTLEDVIKRRILNEEWDDVERKKDVQAKPFRPSEFIELNDKAPKKSLAEEYEDEYMAQKAGDAFVAEDDAKLAVTHREIDVQFRNLFAQLDALSHFHFTPKPATADIEIRTSAPALQMEEKLPVNVSHAEQLAPEEIYEKNKGRNGRTGDLMGDTELTREDRKRRRQRKKEMQKKKTTAIAAQKGPSKPAPAPSTKPETGKAAKTAKAK